MTYTTIITQNPNDPWTSSKFNEYVKGNVEHLAGMTINGTALSALTGGSELLPTSKIALLASGAISAVSSITLSSIPQTYTHLMLYVLLRSGHSSEDFLIGQVGTGGVIDTATTSYSRVGRSLAGTTPSYYADNATTANLFGLASVNFNVATNRFGTAIIQMPFYRSAYFKMVHYDLTSSNGTATNDQKYIDGRGQWLSNSAIDCIKLALTSSTFVSGSYYYLYGLV